MLTPSEKITYLLTFILLYSLPQSGLSWPTGFGTKESIIFVNNPGVFYGN